MVKSSARTKFAVQQGRGQPDAGVERRPPADRQRQRT
jgi:hypothetical protein